MFQADNRRSDTRAKDGGQYQLFKAVVCIGQIIQLIILLLQRLCALITKGGVAPPFASHDMTETKTE